MRENDSFYDIYFIFHPDDIESARRITAQVRATGLNTCFNEEEFGTSAEGIRQLKNGVLRSYTVAFVLSPNSAASQLCNELLQHAVSHGKRLATLILEDDIDVEVHPAIAQHPYVFFRDGDDFGARVDELRAYLTTDQQLKLHTELLVRADKWRTRGRPPDLLLPPDRLDAARAWLATASARHPKPSPLQLEYVHTSRRQPPRRRRQGLRPIALGITLAVALGLGLLLLGRLVAGWQAGQSAGALTSEARTLAAMIAADATAASDSAVGLIDEVAATSAGLRAAAAQTATAISIEATVVARATATGLAQAQIRAAQRRATQIAAQEQQDVAQRLVLAGEDALMRGKADLALALAWEAKDGLDKPEAAHRLIRRAAASRMTQTLADVALTDIHPGGVGFALVPRDRGALQIYDSGSRSMQNDYRDHEAPITAIAFSHDGERLLTASEDGEIILRDGATGAARRRLRKHQGAVTALALDPTGERLISAGSDPTLVAWDLETGDSTATYSWAGGGEGAIYDLLVTGDGERVIGFIDTGDQIIMAQWSAETLALLTADSGGRVYRGADARGEIGYSGGRGLPAFPGDSNTGDLILWELGSGAERARLTDGFNWTFLSGGLAAASDDLVLVAFFQDLALVTVDNSENGRRAAMINLEDGRLLRSLESEVVSLLTTAEFLDAETIVSATSDKRALLWSSVDGGLIRELGRAAAAITQLRVNQAADLAIAQTEDGAAHIWRLTKGAAQPLFSSSDALPGTSISPNGETLLVVEDGGLSLLRVDTMETLVQLPGSPVSSAGGRFAAYHDGRLSVYDYDSGAEARGWGWQGGEISELHLSPDGERLLVFNAADELWLARGDSEAPVRLARIAGRPALVRFAPAGDAILTRHDEFALLWDGGNGQAKAAFPLSAAADVDVDAAFSAAGDSVIFYIRLEDGLAGTTRIRLSDNDVQRHTYIDVAAGALSSDGEFLSLTHSDGRIQVVSARSAAVLHEFRTDAPDPGKLQYLPEADLLMTAAGTDLILWDAAAGAIDQRFAHGEPLVGISSSADGERILTVDERGRYRLWPVESAEDLLARVAAEFAPRALSCAEREQYLVAPLCE